MFGKSAQTLRQLYKTLVPPRWRKLTQRIFIIVFLFAVLAVQFLRGPQDLQVYFYDVGQGDAIHIRMPDGFDVLIDGGPTSRVAEKLGRTMPFWDKTIELMILTHPHADHVTGQIEVLRRFIVAKVLATGVLHTTDEYLTWLEEIKERGVAMEIARAGQSWVLGHPVASAHAKTAVGCPGEATTVCARPRSSATADTMPARSPQHFCCDPPPQSVLAEDIRLEILWPWEYFEGKRVAEGKIGEGGGLNDTSIVTKLTYGNTSFLLMGDATSAVEEEELINQCHSKWSEESRTTQELRDPFDRLRAGSSSPTAFQDDGRCSLRADVLKVGHHGSKYSTSRKFLQVVKPKYAVIQVGKNRYGHPAYATLYRLKQAGVEIFRNDIDEDVGFESDRKEVRLLR